MTVPTTVEPPAPVGHAQVRRERRAQRYALRRAGRAITALPRVRACGRVVCSELGAGVRLSGTGDQARAGYSGLATCGSVHACPVCSAKIGAVRQGDVQTAVQRWHESGGRVAMMTLTMRHRRGQRLADLWDALSAAWHAVSSGNDWQIEQRAHGIPMQRTIKTGKRAGETVQEYRIPVIRVVEVTHGKSGWHVHIHALLLLRAGVSEKDCEGIGDRAFVRWHNALVKRKMPAPLHIDREGKRVGVKCQRLNGNEAASCMADYFAKANFSGSQELTGANQKIVRSAAGRTPFGMLEEVRALIQDGVVPEDGVDVEALWREWERASRGRRQLTWSQGLRQHLGMVVEQTDEEIVEEDRGGTTVAYVSTDVFREVTRRGEEHVPLGLVEQDPTGDSLYLYLSEISLALAERAHEDGAPRLPTPPSRQ